jgi:hypothetical protein
MHFTNTGISTRRIGLLASLAALTILGACGGGGGDDKSATPSSVDNVDAYLGTWLGDCDDLGDGTSLKSRFVVT